MLLDKQQKINNLYLVIGSKREEGLTNFIEDNRSALPTIYNMIEQICEESELLLVKVKLYQSGDALRANLYFTGKKDLVLRNYRASDALALAAFYSVPILVRKDLFTEKATVK